MPLRKYASLEQAQVLDLKGSQTRERTASLEKISDFEDYRTEDGYLYARIRAISSRVNKNHDGWPSVELAGGKETFDRHAKQHQAGFTVQASTEDNAKYGFSTFLGKPVFVDHNNSNPDRARGVIVDAKLHVEDHHTSAHDPYYSSSSVDPEHLPPTWVELLLEVDAKSFPKLAKAIVDGARDSKKGIDGFSMGCDVERSVCNICKNAATAPDEYCKHVKLKGAEFDYIEPKTGRKTSKKSYENCYGIKFFEISAVFDPADETALIREVKASVEKEAVRMGDDPDTGGFVNRTPQDAGACPNCQYPRLWQQGGTSQCPRCHWSSDTGEVTPPKQNRPEGYFGMVKEAPGKQHVPGANAKENRQYEHIKKQYMDEGKSEEEAAEIAARTVNKQKSSSVHTAENPVPQSDMMAMPEYVDTLRKEEVCPVCGSSMEEEHQCDVCGYVAPPEGLDNPDLEKAQQRDLNTDPQQAFNPDAEQIDTETHPSVPDSAQPNSAPSIPPVAASVTDDMAWKIYHPRLAGKINPVEHPIKANPRPATNEPSETIVSDQDRPVTQRTAAQMIAATKGNNMAQRTAADAPTADTKSDKRVDVTGVGGVDHATNEEASKPRGPHSWESDGTTTTVDGKGGVLQDSNEEASRPSQGTENLPTAGRDSDDSGFNKDKTTQDSGKTRTFDNSNEPSSAVTQKAFSHADHEAAKQGVKPLKVPEPFSVDPQARVNVEDDEFFDNPGTPTDQWTGTGGNGVTKQQPPVTPKVGPGNDVRKSTFVDILKIADAEVEMGLITTDEKYERIAELEKADDIEIQTTARVLSRVRTAGLKKNSSVKQGGVGRVPSLRHMPRQASTNGDTPDEALFW